MSLPNFLLAGVIKSGSTTMYHYLKQHPEIFLPEVKEPNYFVSQAWPQHMYGKQDDEVIANAVHNWDDYKQLYADTGNKKAIGDLSVSSFHYGLPVIKEIRNKLGDIKILIILRNPVKRAYSAYLHQVRDTNETLTFEQALLYEKVRLKKAHAPIWWYQEGGFYAEKLEQWLEHFSQVKVLINRDMELDQEDFVRGVLEFLEVDPDMEFEEVMRYNQTGVPQNKLLHHMLMSDNLLKAAIQPVKKVVPTQAWKNMIERMKSGNLKKPGMARTTRAYLIDHFHDDVKKVEKLIDRDLSHWLR